MSPSLFNVYIEQAIRDIKQKVGIVIGGILISMIQFADDIILLAASENHLQTALIEVDNIFSNLKFKINIEKTKTMVCSKQNDSNINISQ